MSKKVFTVKGISYIVVDQMYFRTDLGTEVYHVLRKPDNKPFVLKRSKIKNEDIKKSGSTFYEPDIATKLKHDNIVRYYEFDKEESFNQTVIQMVIEYCNLGSLANIIIHDILLERECIDIIKQICQGIKYLRDQGIAHRDIKPENIYLCVDEVSKGKFVKTAKIGDFGYSKDCSDNIEDMTELIFSSCISNSCYVPPEMLQDGKYTYKSDIFSIGIIMYYMLFKKVLLKEIEGREERLKLQVEGKYTFPVKSCKLTVSKYSILFIHKCLLNDPEKRYNAESLVKDPLFTLDIEEIMKIENMVNIDIEANANEEKLII